MPQSVEPPTRLAKRRVHRIPHEEVRKVLVRHGISSVNKAIEWGETYGAAVILCPVCAALPEEEDLGFCVGEEEGCRARKYPMISAKSVEGILRGKRILGVEFDRVDQILCALESPEVWYLDLAEWYWPPGVHVEAEYETFLSHRAAFERACEMLEGGDAALVFV